MADASETPQPHPSVRCPRDAATLIIVDSSGPEGRFLMGRRRMDLVFMPGKFVFPGGRVDEADGLVPAADELHEVEHRKLLSRMRGTPSQPRARGLAMAAIRETFEETGLVIGSPATENVPAPATTAQDSWAPFFAHAFQPCLAQLSFFARAITPPGRPRRYDTRFFCVDRSAIRHDTGQVDEELSEIDWYTPTQAMDLDLPPITRVVIEDLADRLQAGPMGPLAHPVPFYHHDDGNFRRDLLTIA